MSSVKPGVRVSEEWHFVIRVAEIEPAEAIATMCNGREVAIYRVGDNFFATDNRCTHAAASLADGYLNGELIECPLHQGLFNVRTGAAVCSPATRPVRTYPTRVAEGQVQIRF